MDDRRPHRRARHVPHRSTCGGDSTGTAPTLDLADLLLTKLQVWEINQKDLGDIACLLADCAVSAGGALSDPPPAGASRAIDLARVVALTGADWGLCHTVERNLRRVAALAASGAAGRWQP